MKLASDLGELADQLCVTAYTAFDFRCYLCGHENRRIRVHRVEVVPVLIAVDCDRCHFPNRFRGLKGDTVVIGPTFVLDESPGADVTEAAG